MPRLIDQLIATWPYPQRGVVRTLPAHEIPTDALYDASNVLLVPGAMAPRPGLTSTDAFTFPAQPMGFTSFANASATLQPVVATRQRMYVNIAGVWTDRTGTLLTGTQDQQIRFTAIAFGTPTVNYLVLTNGADSPKQWNGVDANYTNIAGSPPNWTDVTNAGDRIMGITPPYRINWGEQAALSPWYSLNSRYLADTPDWVVAINVLGTGNPVVYKEQTVWLGTSQAGSSASAFTFDYVGEFDGPASPASVVRADKINFWLSKTGRIYAFDGSSRPIALGDGIFPALNADMDPLYVKRSFGVYDSENRVLAWTYARVGDSGGLHGLVMVNLAYPEFGIPQPAVFMGVWGPLMACGGTDRDSVGVPFVRLFTTTKSATWSGTDDLGTAIPGHWQTGLQRTPDMSEFRVEAIEPFFERGAGYGTVQLYPTSSYTFGTRGGTVGLIPTSIPLTDPEPIEGYKGVDARGRFLGMKFTFSTAAGTIRYMGSTLHAHSV